MNRHVRWILIAGLAVAALVLSCSDEPLTPSLNDTTKAPLINNVVGAQYVDGAYIVVFKDNVANVEMSIDDVGNTNGFVAEHRYASALKGFSGRLTDEQVEALRNDPRVAYIEQDQVAHIVTTQTGATWGIDRVDQLDLPLSTTYEYNYTGAGVDAYIIDTGILLTHSDFGGRALKGVDEITSGGTAIDQNGHGTHVAGTVGGTTYGIAKSVTLYAVRVLDASGSGTYAQVIAGVDWVTANHSSSRPSVANMSLGGSTSTSLDTAVQNSIASGVTYCIAAGNYYANASNYSPARVAAAITVGATTSSDGFASYSNYGSVVDILAPGSSVKSDYYSSTTATATMSGTSMATPHVTGACALYLEANPSATPAEVAAGLVAASTANTITSVPSGTVNKFLYTLFSGGSTPTVPAAPVLSSPTNGATSVSIPPTLSWAASTGATSYAVQVSTSSSFTTTAYSASGLTTTSTSATGLATSTTYYWRVNATNSAGTSDWSTVYSFTTAASSGSAPAAPTLSSPANGATGVSTSPTLSWSASTGATSYRVQVSTSSTFSTLTRDVSGITTTSTTVTGLSRYTRFYWRVNATNAYGTSSWSSVRYFTTRRW
jgi:subtilisin family serine protease